MSAAIGCRKNSEGERLQLAIASGKGGTGKTTLSVSIARSVEEPVVYLDCDVEEPNGGLFLDSGDTRETVVTVPVPVVDKEKCTGCGICTEFCQFNALAVAGGTAMMFPELCHSCGGCVRLCPADALEEKESRIGILRERQEGHITLVDGLLDVGKAMSPPLINRVKEHVVEDGLNIIDCPPGSSCPMLAAVSGADFTILVTEPTPFGLHDLKLAAAAMNELGLDYGVVINRSDSGDARVVDWCRETGVPLLLEIPESRAVAEAYAAGGSVLEAAPELAGQLRELIAGIRERCAQRRVVCG